MVMIPRYDLKDGNESKFMVGNTKNVGCSCTKCSWKGVRRVMFLLNLHQRLDPIAATTKIKGQKHWLSCPKCDGDVVTTHVIGR